MWYNLRASSSGMRAKALTFLRKTSACAEVRAQLMTERASCVLLKARFSAAEMPTAA